MMKSNDHFLQSVCALAIPVALQSMLQSSFSMVDQIMIGQLGEIQGVADDRFSGSAEKNRESEFQQDIYMIDGFQIDVSVR